jgi:hypothetical protein
MFHLKTFQTGGTAQVVESLLCKHKVLSTNPNLTKKKKEKKESFSLVWWYTPIVTELIRLTQEDCDFEVNLVHTVRFHVQKKERCSKPEKYNKVRLTTL